MDACSFFHFLQLSGIGSQMDMLHGTISFWHGKHPNNWPSPLYDWSVLLANEPAPCFQFSKLVERPMPNGNWIGLEAEPVQSTLAFMKKFGFAALPVLLVRPSATVPQMQKEALPKAELYAGCSELHLSLDADPHLLQLSFARTGIQCASNQSYIQPV